MCERLRLLLFSADAATLARELRRLGPFYTLAIPDRGTGLLPSVQRFKPDVIIVDAGLPDLDARETADQLARHAPYATLILLTPLARFEEARALMTAGASGLMPRPVEPRDLARYVLQVHGTVLARKQHWVTERLALTNPRRPRVIAIFSPKGGVGKSTLATNLAVALRRVTEDRVLLLDMDLASGDAAALLDLVPRYSILDYVRALGTGGEVRLTTYLTGHHSGIELLAAPASPDQAELIPCDHVKQAITDARQLGDWILVDTSPAFSEPVLTVLDEADTAILLMTPDLTSLKSARTALSVMEELGYPAEKAVLVMNQAQKGLEQAEREATEILGRPILASLPHDSRLALAAANTGEPFVIGWPASALARGVVDLARRLVAEVPAVGPAEPAVGGPPARRWFWQRLRWE